MNDQEKQGVETKVEVEGDFNASDAHHARLPSAAHDHSARYVWYVILLLTVVNMVNYVDRMALAVLAPFIKADLQLTDAELGLLTGFAFAIFYAVCAIPIARWADHGIRRNIIALALTTWSVMTALSGAAQNFGQLFLARIGVGAGEAGSYAPGASIVCDYVPLQRRTGALSVHVFGNATGILVGMSLAGWLGEAIGWRWAFLALGFPGIVLAVVVRFTLREPKRGFFDAVNSDKTSLSLNATIGFLWRCRTYRLLTLFWVAIGFVEYGLMQWWASFYVRIFGSNLSSIGVYLGTAIGAGAGMGILMGGFLANRATRRDVRLPLRIGAAAALLSAPAAVGSLFVPSLAGSIALVWLTGLFWGVSHGPVLAAQYSVVTARMRATAGSITVFFMSALGFGLGPFCVGLLSDMLAPALGAQSLRYALIAPVCLTPVIVIALLAAAKTLQNDLRAVGAQAEDSHLATVTSNLAVAK